MNFVNFHNDATFACFEWIKQGGLGDIDQLMTEAVERATQEAEETNGDASDLLLEHLSSVLHERAEEKLNCLSEDCDICRLALFRKLDSTDSDFIAGLLCSTVSEICFDVLAEALILDCAAKETAAVS